MGIHKERLLEEQERGWRWIGDKYVCPECFEDDAIRDFIGRCAVEPACSYCLHRCADHPIAAHIDDVLGFIVRGLETQYGDPSREGVPWETAEGGWQGAVLDSADVVEQVPVAEGHDALRDDILSSLQDREWCQRGFWALRPEEALIYGWTEFCETVKHKTRYLFTVSPDLRGIHRGADEVRPADMLEQLGRVVSTAGLLHDLPAEQAIFRGRSHDATDALRMALEFGPPPADDARSNRMSPAGIPMFYGAFDKETAGQETLRGPGEVVSVARFQAAVPLHVLDLSSLPPVPSIFDESMSDVRPGLLFLHDFARDVAGRVERDGREHVDYVPTQIVTEFFRRVFVDSQGQSLDGILYNSSRTRGRCCVLFLSGAQVGDEDDEEHLDEARLILPRGGIEEYEPDGDRSSQQTG